MLAIALVLGFHASSSALLQDAVIGHRVTLDSIRTFSASVTFLPHQHPDMAQTGKYFRNGDDWCMQLGTSETNFLKRVCVAHKIFQLSRARVDRHGNKHAVPQVAGSIWHAREAGPLEVWQQFGLAFEVGIDRYDHLGAVVAVDGAEATADGDRIDGRPVIRVGYTSRWLPGGGSEQQSIRVTLWLDPARGYLPVRRDVRDTNSGSTSRTEYSDFLSVSGIDFPTRATLTPGDATGRGSAHTTTVTEVQVNRSLPPDTFERSLPPGSRITDDVRKSEYVAGPDWKPIGPEKPWSRLGFVPPAAPADAPFKQSPPVEARGWTWWLVAVSGVLLVVGGAAAVVRRAVGGRDTPA